MQQSAAVSWRQLGLLMSMGSRRGWRRQRDVAPTLLLRANYASGWLAGCCYAHLGASAWLSGLQAESLLLEYTQLGDEFTQIVQEYADTKVGGCMP